MTATKQRSAYRCSACGHDHPKWVGRCEACSQWNTVAEERIARPRSGRSQAPQADPAAVVRLADVATPTHARYRSGIDEFDFVMGGGMVPGSIALIGGEPGIGKSTILLQVTALLAAAGRSVLYATGEESPYQLRLRAERLDEPAGQVPVVAETDLESILEAARARDAELLVIDSIQTVSLGSLDGAPGSVAQVRECAARLMRFAKESSTAVVVVGHVTKGGGIAGPKTLEHIVDTVLYFEGESSLDFRLLRAAKNRYGSVDELGVFRMTAAGLTPVANPSAAFLAARDEGISGAAVTALIEGSRPVLVEVQALTAPAGYGTPQRVATGLDPKRLALLLAVLERRANLAMGQLDVFVRASAGLRLSEPSADLAVVAALISSLRQQAIPGDTLLLGEIGLGGEVRPVTAFDRRLVEAQRSGFSRVFASARQVGTGGPMEVVGIRSIDQLVNRLGG